MWAALLLWTCVSTCLAQAERDRRYDFDIARGSLASALEQVSRQTALQVITQLSVAESTTQELGPFIGHATIDEALKALIRDTDLAFRWQDHQTIVIFVPVVQPPHADDNIQEVLVTGTRLFSEDGPAPIRVYGRERLERYGVSSVSDFSRLLTQQPFAFGPGQLQSGAQFAQLRGLGPDTTLVLINGRRVPPSANSISLNAVDLNIVPATAVDRIEVMSDAASSIYGADAVGGVVNIILKDKIEEPEVYLHYGQADGGGTQRRAAVSLGTANERLKSALVLDYYDTDALMGAQRELWRNQDYRRFGGLDYRVSSTNPANVYSLTGQPLPGLSSSRAAVPAGTTGPLTPADFFATDGATNLQSSFSDWSITPQSRRISAYGSAEYESADWLTLFGEALLEDNEVTAVRGSPAISRQVVPASNPFNPFGLPVVVDYSFAGMDPISHRYEAQLLRVVGGARGWIDGWDWELTGLHHAELGGTTTQGEIDRLLLISAVNSTDPETAVNLFATGPPGSAELMDALRSPRRKVDFSTASSQLSAFMKGPVFKLGPRTAQLVIGGEWRRDSARFAESDRPVDASRDIASIFGEIGIPLLDELSVKMAARADAYGASARIVNPQYGLTWRPSRDWLFRAAYGTGFRPPSLFELYMPMFRSSVVIADPLRRGEVSNVNVVVSGNPELDVLTARSFTAGFVFTPSESPRMRFGGSYWRVLMDNRILAPTYQELLNPDSSFAYRVVRDPANSQDLQMGLPGRLRSIDLERVNYGYLDTSGIDVDTSFSAELPWGCLRLDLAVTWVDEYLSRDMNQALPLDRVGIANVQGTIPEWRMVGTVTWKAGRFGVSSTTTFAPSYQDAHWSTGTLDRRIGSQTVVDVQTWMELGDMALLGDSTLTLGARNLFDQYPEFAHAGAAMGYDISQYDLVGRFIYFRVGKRF